MPTQEMVEALLACCDARSVSRFNLRDADAYADRICGVLNDADEFHANDTNLTDNRSQITVRANLRTARAFIR
ncbi:hypothetical protein BN2476_630081 [Paraburkholderia piptadeniae]|uniref:Uncharacterized protein n=1 Tax=Paraburkholderia piptadeniae TaxID=1701573 RepID=A0A1N7SLR0_9BURK|nr:hypothetical protein BN2476_630081 [Paraburkholderia piptadeniae]